MSLNSVRSSPEINEIHPEKVSRSVQMSEKGKEETRNSIFSPPPFLMSKPVWVFDLSSAVLLLIYY